MMKGSFKKGSFKTGEDAVSPVIGVILMVAITVILAAVIGAFVFGMGSGVQKTYTVSVTATQVNSTYIDFTVQGGADIAQVDYFNSTVDGSNDAGYPNPEVGHGWSSVCDSAATNHVIVVATFKDGAQQVVLDTHV